MTERLKAALAQDAELVQNKLLTYYKDTTDQDIQRTYDAEKYSLTAGGKRIRPFLVLEFARVFGGNMDAALVYAAAVEMMHTCSLIHDDLPCMDDDDYRRGRLTNHKVFGEAEALLAGDSLMIRALQIIAECRYAEPKETLRAVCELARAAGSDGMIGGQMTDMRGEREKLDFTTLLKLHSQKTGAMIRVSGRLGCIAAGVSEDDGRFAAVDAYTSKIGLCFQIVDDVLDVTADAAELGKPTGSDAQEGKTTFMSFMSPEEAMKYAAQLTEDAKDALKHYPECWLLCDLADYLLSRRS